MSKINAFLIGAQKAGSTSVFNWLGQHPDIYAPEFYKDVHLFSSPKFKLSLNQELSKFYADYKAESIILHGAVNYLIFPKSIATIKEHNPQSKIIVLLRNPIHRAYSAYKYFVKRGKETRSFEEALHEENEILKNGTYNDRANLTYFHHGLYAAQLNNVFRHFKREQIYIGFFEDVVKNQSIEINNMFQFLGLAEMHTIDFKQKNSTGVVKNKKLNEKLNSSWKNPVVRILKKIISPEKRKEIKEFLIDSNTSKKSYASLSVEIEIDLGKRYQQDIKELSEILNMDLFWKWNIPKY